MSIHPELMKIIVCPGCHGTLVEADAELACQECSLRYPIRDGIPVLLVDEARKPA